MLVDHFRRFGLDFVEHYKFKVQETRLIIIKSRLEKDKFEKHLQSLFGFLGI